MLVIIKENIKSPKASDKKFGKAIFSIVLQVSCFPPQPLKNIRQPVLFSDRVIHSM